MSRIMRGMSILLDTETTSGTLDRVDIGRTYQFNAAGTWDGATVLVEVWNTTLGDWATLTTLTSATPERTEVATGPRFRVSISGGGGSENVAVEYLRLPASGASVTNASVNTAIAADQLETKIALGLTVFADRVEAFSDSVAKKYLHLLSVPISAARMVDGTKIFFNWRVDHDVSSFGILPDAANKFWIGAKFGGPSAPDLANGAWMNVTPEQFFHRAEGTAAIILEKSGSNLRPVASSYVSRRAYSTQDLRNPFVTYDPVLDLTNEMFHDMEKHNPTVYTHPEGAATTLNFFLVWDVTVADSIQNIVCAYLDIKGINVLAGSFT